MTRRNRGGPPDEIFLSHATADRRFVDTLARTLRRHGLSVWYSRTHLRCAQQWHDEIGKALARCNWFAVVMTEDAIKSKWVKRELLYALRNDRFHERIVPILYKRCDPEQLSWALPTFQFVDFTHGSRAGYQDLLRIWGLLYREK